jgi:glycerol-3-phosphate cytidylyltransferase-like family protein
MPSPLLSRLHSKKLREDARSLREALTITMAVSKEAIARSQRLVAAIQEQRKSKLEHGQSVNEVFVSQAI